MIGVDTNVLVRFLAVDDAAQHAQATRFLTARTADDPAFVCAVTLAETVLVLHRRLRFPIADVIAAVRSLLASEALVIEHGEDLSLLLNSDTPLGSDIADYLIVWSASLAGCHRTVTFDRRAAKSVAGMELLA